MSDNQKISSNLLEEERIKKELSKRFGERSYWTFQEGLNFFLPLEYRNSFPLSVLINDYLFETLKREVETQRLETTNDIDEVEQILAYDPVADREKSKSKRIGKQRKLSFSEIQEEKRKFFCSKIKIKPENLICYIIDHIDLFSSEIEIPSWLVRLIDDVQGPIKNNEGERREDRDNQNSQYTFPGKQINSWNELEITLLSHETITIKTSHVTKNLTFQQIGMENKQNPEKPTKVWETLKFFAELDGKYPNSKFEKATLEKAKDRIAELNRTLKQFFNLPQSIFKNHFKKHSCWETQFKISSKLYHSPDENTPLPSMIESEIESASRSVNLSESKLYDE